MPKSPSPIHAAAAPAELGAAAELFHDVASFFEEHPGAVVALAKIALKAKAAGVKLVDLLERLVQMRDRVLGHLLGDLADLIAEHPVAAAVVCRKLSQAILRESSEQEEREREERERSQARGYQMGRTIVLGQHEYERVKVEPDALDEQLRAYARKGRRVLSFWPSGRWWMFKLMVKS